MRLRSSAVEQLIRIKNKKFGISKKQIFAKDQQVRGSNPFGGFILFYRRVAVGIPHWMAGSKNKTFGSNPFGGFL